MNPNEAIWSGIPNYAEKYADESVDGLKKILEKCQHFKDQSSQILNDKAVIKHLDSKTIRYAKVLHLEVDSCLNFSHHKGYLLAQVSFLYGIQTSLPNFFGKRIPLPLVRTHLIMKIYALVP